MYEPFTCADLLQAWQAPWCGRRFSRLSLDTQRALHKLQGELAHEILARDLMNYPKNPRIYALVSSVNTPPPMVWSPLALARGLGPGLRLGKTTSQPSSLYLLHVA